MTAATALLLLALPLAAQDFEKFQVDRASGNHIFTEGPAWSRDGYLVFSDIPRNVLLKMTPGAPIETLREDSGGAAGNAFDSQGRLYTCETHTRRVVRTGKKGALDVLADKWEGKRLNAPNDITVRKDGNVYFTDPAFGEQADTRELDFYGVFRISPKGDLSLVSKSQTRPNGIALSPNGKILYVANSDERNVRAYDLDRNGEASNARIVIASIEGVPDGIRTDEKGNLYVAARQVYVYTPEGKRLGEVPLSETPSNIAFGDPDLGTLYITARTTVYSVRLKVKGALPY